MPTIIDGAGIQTGTLDLVTPLPVSEGGSGGTGFVGFSAYQSVAQTGLGDGVVTKINFQTEEFDIGGYFNTTTMVYAPLVAGYYQVNASITPSTVTTGSKIYLYLGGASFKRVTVSSATASANVSAVIYLDGTGSGSQGYIECFGSFTGTTPAVSNTQSLTYFQAALISRT